MPTLQSKTQMKTITLSITACSLLTCLAHDVAAKTIFITPPIEVKIHNPTSIEYQRNKTTLSIVVPENAGAPLESVALHQLPSIDAWNWGKAQPTVYLGEYSIRAKGKKNLAKTKRSMSDRLITIQLIPAIEPGQQVNIVFRGSNPEASVYQWATKMTPFGENPITYDGPTLRLNVYEPDYFR